MIQLSDLKNYKKWSPAMKAAFWFIFASMIQKALSFITVPIFTRVMETEQYGIYSTYLSWSAIIAVFLTLNLDSGAYSNVIGKSKTEKEKNEMTVSFLSLCFCITTMALIATIIFIKPISSFMELSSSLIILMFFGIYSMPVANYWLFKQRFDYKYKTLVLIVLLKSALNIILGLYFINIVSVNVQAWGRIISIVLIECTFSFFLYIDFIRKAGKCFAVKKWKKALKFQLPLIPHFLSMNFLLSSDRIMIQKMIGLSEAGVYSVSYSAGQIMTIFKTCIVDSMRPWVYERLNKKEYDRITSSVCGVTFLVTLVSIVFAAVAPELIKILAAPQYYEAIYVIPPVALSSLFTFIYQIFVVVETYYEKTTKIMKASVCAAILNLILNFFLIPVYGYIIAGYTTLVSYIFLSVFHYIAVKEIQREKGIKNFFAIKGLVCIATIGIIACIAVSFLYQYPILRYSILLICISGIVILRNLIFCLFNYIRDRWKEKHSS